MIEIKITGKGSKDDIINALQLLIIGLSADIPLIDIGGAYCDNALTVEAKDIA